MEWLSNLVLAGVCLLFLLALLRLLAVGISTFNTGRLIGSDRLKTWGCLAILGVLAFAALMIFSK